MGHAAISAGQTFADLDDDERTLDQMRCDILIERVARAIDASTRLRSRLIAQHDIPDYADLYAQQQALDATERAILATVDTLMGDEERNVIETAAHRIWHKIV